MLEKRLRRLFILVLLFVLGNACQKTPANDGGTTTPSITETTTESSQTEDSIIITLAVSELNLDYYKPLIVQFEQANPDIQVQLVRTDDVTSTDDDPMRAMASSFDVFPYFINRQGNAQYLLDLRPLQALDPQFDIDDFWPGLLPSTTEPLWAVPTGAAYQLTYFDKSAFDAATLPYPTREWTIDDFLTSAIALTVQEEGVVTRWGYVPGQLRYAPLLATQLNAPLQSGEDLRLTDPDVVTAVQWVSDLFTLHQVSPWLQTYKPVERQIDNGDPSIPTLINSGTAAMWHSTHLLYDANKEHIGVTAVPQGSTGFAAEPIITGFAVSRGTRSPEAAWQLVHFLSRQLPPDEMGLPTSTLVPARKSIVSALDYWEQLPVKLATILQYTVENSHPPRISYAATEPLLEAFALHIDESIPVMIALEQETAAIVSPPATSEAIVISEPESEPSEDATQITFTTYSYLFEQHQLLSEEFQNVYPDIVVNVQRADNVSPASAQESLINNNTDCFVEQSLSLLNSELRAVILPLDPLLEIDGSTRLEDFYPVQTSYFTENGQLWAIPAFSWTQLIEYNRDLFFEANISEPELDWTLEDFLEIAQQMTVGSGESKRYGYAEAFTHLFDSGLPSFGVEYIDSNSGVPIFNYASTAEMMIWYADLARLHKVQPVLTGDPPLDYSQFDQLIRNEQAAMWPFPESILLQAFDEPLGFDIGLVPIPLGPSGSRGDLTKVSHGYYIMADSSNREACWQWITFLTHHPQAIQLRQGIPARIETAESDEYTTTVGEELANANRAFMASAQPAPLIEEPSWFFPGHLWLREAYIKAGNRELSVEEALAAADVKFTQYRQCLIDQDAFEDYEAQVACVISVDPALEDRYR